MLSEQGTALVFPGQGSQVVGMGSALSAAYDTARQTFEEADDILGFALSRLCFEGPQETLTETVNAQPALYVAGIAALRTLYETLGYSFKPAYVGGHSLGELTALTAAGSLSFADGVQVVRRRGELMRDAGENSPGGMAALLGLDIEAAEALCISTCAEIGGVLVVANDNCPGQVVIAGDNDSLSLALARARDVGAKRAVRLPVSIAAHSPLMAHAAEEFQITLAVTQFADPMIPIVGNINALPLTTADAIRADLRAQLISPVRWTDSVRTMLKAGVATFIELGSKDVLTGLLRRISHEATGIVVDSPESILTVQAL